MPLSNAYRVEIGVDSDGEFSYTYTFVPGNNVKIRALASLGKLNGDKAWAQIPEYCAGDGPIFCGVDLIDPPSTRTIDNAVNLTFELKVDNAHAHLTGLVLKWT